MGMKWTALAILLAVAFIPGVHATYLGITAADMNDTIIVTWAGVDTNKNWGTFPSSGDYGITSYTGGYYTNVLFYANFSKYITADSNITSANISVYSDTCNSITGAVTINLHMMNVGWLEGAGNNAAGEVGNASWVGNATTRWIGGSFSSLNYNTTVFASAIKTCTPNTKERVTFELNGIGLYALNNMLDGTFKNYGFVMNISGPLNGASTIRVIFKENGTAAYTPRMELIYSVALPTNTVTITSPGNTTYTGTTSVQLAYSVTNTSASCSWSAYSLDGAANVTLDCLNGTVAVATGSHAIRVWLTDENGLYTDVEYFTSSYASYTLNITDELTYNTLYNGTIPGVIYNSSTTKLYAYCAASTETTVIDSNPKNVSMNCEFEELRLEIKDANGTQWRTLHPTLFNGTLEFIMVNETATDAIEQTWEMYDVTGDYTNGFLKVTKAIGNYGLKTIEEKLIDASGNAVLYLIPGERYCFSVLDSAMTGERNLGCLYATTETSTRTEISRVPYAPALDLTYKDVLVYFAWDKDSQYIQGIYNDTTETTTSVNFTVYNATNPTQVMFTSVSTFNYVIFTYNAVNTNGTYIAVITAINGKYGTLVEKKTIGFYGTGQEKPSLPSGYGWLLAAAGGLISIFMMLAFGRKRQNIGVGFSVLIMILFMYWGWFDSVPWLGWSFFTLLAFIAFIGFFIKRDNT